MKQVFRIALQCGVLAGILIGTIKCVSVIQYGFDGHYNAIELKLHDCIFPVWYISAAIATVAAAYYIIDLEASVDQEKERSDYFKAVADECIDMINEQNVELNQVETNLISQRSYTELLNNECQHISKRLSECEYGAKMYDNYKSLLQRMTERYFKIKHDSAEEITELRQQLDDNAAAYDLADLKLNSIITSLQSENKLLKNFVAVNEKCLDALLQPNDVVCTLAPDLGDFKKIIKEAKNATHNKKTGKHS